MLKIKKIILLVLQSRQNLFWILQAFFIRFRIKHDVTVKNGDFNGTKLILMPHCDDEWIGCSQIICNNTQVTICDMDMSGGDSVELHSIRKSELLKVITKYNLKYKLLGGNRIQELLEILQSIRPNYVFLPFFKDWHSEHIEVMALLKDVLKIYSPQINIAMYQVSLPISGKYITHANGMDLQLLNEKWDTFKKIYTTQNCIKIVRFKANEIINGKYIKAFSAEAYCVMTKEQWLNNYDSLILNKSERQYSRNNINSLFKIHRFLEQTFIKR